MLKELKSYVNEPDLTPETCKDLCSGYKYFGLVYAKECYCGTAFRHKDEKDELECNRQCTGILNRISTVDGICGHVLHHCIPGNSSIACGGVNRLSLYERKVQPDGEIFEFPLHIEACLYVLLTQLF